MIKPQSRPQLELLQAVNNGAELTITISKYAGITILSSPRLNNNRVNANTVQSLINYGMIDLKGTKLTLSNIAKKYMESEGVRSEIHRRKF